jgi:hypothetical protein
VSTRRAAVRAGRLRGEGVLDLRVDHRLLDSAEEVLGLGELQPQGVGVTASRSRPAHRIFGAVLRAAADYRYELAALLPLLGLECFDRRVVNRALSGSPRSKGGSSRQPAVTS